MFFPKKKISFVVASLILLGGAFALAQNGENSQTPQNSGRDSSREADKETSLKPKEEREQLVSPISKIGQDSYDDIRKQYPMDAPLPDNVKTVVEYDPVSGHYVLRTYVGKTEIASPFTMTEQEYRDYSAGLAMRKYWQEKNKQGEKNNEDKFSISDMKFDIGPADKIFGPGGVQVKTQGSAELIFGVRANNVDNPALPQRQRHTVNPEFEQKIQLNVNGKVGDKLVFGLNYNTEASFDHDQKLISLKYQPSKIGGGEDDIIRNIEAGNVSMQLNSSLISGSSSLFGVKTELQFGKLNVTALASQQNSESKTVNSKGGVQTTPFEVNIDDYDENRHFFLAHFFRDGYEKNISQLPYISSGVQINRIEVWVTNKRGDYNQARNIIAFMDLGEAEKLNNNYWLSAPGEKQPRNEINKLYSEVIALPGLRDIKQMNEVLSVALEAKGIHGGEDYEKIESARRLDLSEFSFNKDLGYISLRSALNPDEALAVAFEYTYRGRTYQVGEFSTDASIVAPKALVLKLLKGNAQSPSLKNWDLMMKNIYNIGASRIEADNFKLDIVYRNDSVGTDLQYISAGDIANQLLLRVMRLDRLNPNQNPGPDGIFDFVEGYTVQASNGRIIFPVLEPFGQYLADRINDPHAARLYTYPELYDSTLVVAREYSEKNKFRLVGKYKGASGSEIRLNAMNVPRGSVTVTAGGKTLVENIDYTVDYTMGTVSIINQSLLDSSTNIEVKLENQSMFSMQRKTLLGTHLEYQFNKDFSLGGTLMHLSEMPLTTKVNTGNEPISNTIWGLNSSWRGESQWLTNMIDKLPFVNATKPSTIALNAEFAQLIPGHSQVISSAGLAYVDDFETTQTNIDVHYPYYWRLASTPSVFPESKNSDYSYGSNRSLLSWYYVDKILNDNRRETPAHLREDIKSKSNHLTRNVEVSEVFPNKDRLSTETTLLTVLNLSYYPNERGPYNLDTDGMNPDGSLTNPQKRWGGIMRKIDRTDFEAANIEYIEFWMMDPFINDKSNSHKGGSLYFNLGDISEDVLKDGKKFFEHGLSIDGDLSKNEATTWGVVPKTQSTVTAFDNTPGARKNQDVGLNGLSSEQERSFPLYQDYLQRVKTKVSNPAAISKIESDPAGDNYRYYRGSEYDKEEASILERYKYYNGTEGNSPDATEVSEIYSTSATLTPDVEDVNDDNTLNEYEKYYEYKVAIDRGEMEVGRNYITDKITKQVYLADGTTESVNWYQFRIPIRGGKAKGNIRNIKSIRFMRIYLTDFEEDIHLRFATMDLVRGEWRAYNKELQTMPSTGAMNVQSVNIEENSDKTPVNYLLPPGVTRQTDPGQPQLLQQNEQSMLLKVTNLSPGESKAVYKNTSYDMRTYKRLQMFVHAEQLPNDVSNLKDYELTCFIRLGSDMVNNYYEYKIPLKLTPAGIYSSSDRHVVWPKENMFDFPFSVLTEAKLKRNRDRQNGLISSNITPYTVADPNNQNNQITVVGNPSISEVENIMIGICNSNGREPKSGEVWVNELRMSEFDENGGWGAMANLAIGLSDIGSINFAGRTETSGFGSIESNVTNRRMDDLYQMTFSTALDLGRFLPEKAKIQLPAYYSYSNETLSPKYNPLDEDVLLKDALDNVSREERDSIKSMALTVATTQSFNISGAKVNIRSSKPKFYDPANLSFGYSQNETKEHNPEIEVNQIKDQKASISYNYSFNPQPWEPFKESKALANPIFKLIKEFNLYYLPTSISFNTNMIRRFSQVRLRSFDASNVAVAGNQSYSNNFMWDRQFELKYNLTRSMSFSLSTAMNANIDEGRYLPEISKDYYEAWRDTVWSSIRNLGRPYAYQQVFNASWALPINKLPLMDWVSSSRITYNSDYKWDRGAQIEGGTKVGNIASGRGDWQADASFNFETLYNKSQYLQGVNRRYGSQRNAAEFKEQSYTQSVNLEKAKALTINHRLGSEILVVSARGKDGLPIRISYKTRNTTSLEVISQTDADSVLITVTTRDPNQRSLGRKILDFSVRSLMMLRSASLNYSTSNSLMIPGFKPEPKFMGQQMIEGMNAPGYGFVFGLIDGNSLQEIKSRDWLYLDTLLTSPAVAAATSRFEARVALEPIPGLKIDLNATRRESKNTTTMYMIPGMPSFFAGNYEMTTVLLATAFDPIGDVSSNYASKAFDTFLANRRIVAQRLNEQYASLYYPHGDYFDEKNLGGKLFDPANGRFVENSVDVLIPAFWAAYSGGDAHSTNTSPFPSLLKMLPNWNISYDGLSRISFIKKHLQSLRLTHRYTSSYNVGSYTSFSTWTAAGNAENTALGFIRDVQTNNPIPSSPYDIASVSLVESFNPLIGLSATLKNSLEPELRFQRQRNLTLNLASLQLIETRSDELVVGLGYLLKDFDLILRLSNNKQSKIKNDLKIKAELSYKDIKSLLRKIDEDVTQPSSGSKLVALRIMADYVFSSKMNIQLFYDYQANTPFISTSYPVSAGNFGVSFKFMLTR